MGLRVEEEGGSEGRPGTGRIGVATSPHAPAGRLPSGVGGREPSAHRRSEPSRTVGAVVKAFAGAARATDDISVVGTAVVTSRLTPRPRGPPRADPRGVVRCWS